MFPCPREGAERCSGCRTTTRGRGQRRPSRCLAEPRVRGRDRELPRHRLLPRDRQRRGHLRSLAKNRTRRRSEEHTSELQSLMRISYAVFCLKNKTTHHISYHTAE